MRKKAFYTGNREVFMEKTVMQSIYEQLKTPYKYGAVLKLEGRKTDSPKVLILKSVRLNQRPCITNTL